MTHYFSDDPTGPERRRADHRRPVRPDWSPVRPPTGSSPATDWTGAPPSCCASRRRPPDRRGSWTSAAAAGRSRWPSRWPAPARGSTRSTSTTGRWRSAATTPRPLGVAVGSGCCRPDRPIREARYDEIWSNPPIRIGKAALHELLLTWLARLEPDGVARLVVAKNLGRRHPAALADRAGVRRRPGRRPAKASASWWLDERVGCGPAAWSESSPVLRSERPCQRQPPAPRPPTAPPASGDPAAGRPGRCPIRSTSEPITSPTGSAEAAHPRGEERPDHQGDRGQRRRSGCRALVTVKAGSDGSPPLVALLEGVRAGRRGRPLPERADQRPDAQARQRQSPAMRRPTGRQRRQLPR